jgi:hypothetical protein
MGWSWAELQDTPTDVIGELVILIQEEQAELQKAARKR